jgi:hypothetical protein
MSTTNTILDDELKHQRQLVRHIQNVQNSCILLAEKLAEDEGNKRMARHLIANAMIHDNSKFFGIEWKYLREEIKKNGSSHLFEAAVQSHQENNMHHPEFWGGIHNMPDIYLAELVCDIKARSDEFGTDIRNWVKEVASKKYGFSLQSKTYRKIKHFLDLLLDSAYS